MSDLSDPRLLAHEFQLHTRELRHYLARQLGSHEIAADLCQEIYLRLSRNPPQDTVENARALFFRVARNLLIDYRRQQQARPLAEALDEQIESSAPGPELQAMQQQQLECLQRALAGLPLHLRQALLWNRFEGLTQREIGERLGVSESMAGRYVVKAIEYCQQWMGESL
ncbi:sigma-70 family RNA polymerase sigma factor [Pseudomonas sp. ABC1]|uniref:RNA polymerase sigma factor n=1 Tax=Pseudomonas sp. ABC1 TaxID=2748080 RepID=UPI0015C366E6|nr:sigma-70 family RNA polymerase sigma factor [Pseudomonas sp. ABC1]QLF94227.1 sigma-70 family RNA polymerase sigma factor [Pseudomonas sp. ABC1]